MAKKTMKQGTKRGTRQAAKGRRAAQPKPGLLAVQLTKIAREFHGRGWALGTSGNYSAVLNANPLRLLITSSGLDKSALTERDFLEIDGAGNILAGKGKPSAETFLHLAVAGKREVGCILHTHSVWSTLLSERFASQGELYISGYEMLKGLQGVRTHEHRERIPIFANAQEIPALANKISNGLGRENQTHGFLLSGHGLYTWGVDVAQARRHVEIFEFLLEVIGRREFGGAPVTEKQ
jgi:methylthioribulose-1-phosphate dehydratase